MFATVRAVNRWFRSANRADLDDLVSKIIMSERQQKVFEMFYVKRKGIGFIADTLCVSQTVVNVELKEIRNKIYATIRQ